jgi:hypothetical protein
MGSASGCRFACRPPRFRWVGCFESNPLFCFPHPSLTCTPSQSTTQGASTEAPTVTSPRKHFISNIIDEDLKSGKHKTVLTRFPPVTAPSPPSPRSVRCAPRMAQLRAQLCRAFKRTGGARESDRHPCSCRPARGRHRPFPRRPAAAADALACRPDAQHASSIQHEQLLDSLHPPSMAA